MIDEDDGGVVAFAALAIGGFEEFFGFVTGADGDDLGGGGEEEAEDFYGFVEVAAAVAAEV